MEIECYKLSNHELRLYIFLGENTYNEPNVTVTLLITYYTLNKANSLKIFDAFRKVPGYLPYKVKE